MPWMQLAASETPRPRRARAALIEEVPFQRAEPPAARNASDRGRWSEACEVPTDAGAPSCPKRRPLRFRDARRSLRDQVTVRRKTG